MNFPEIKGYKIIETIGEGGFGVVYKAKSLPKGRFVALKVVKPLPKGSKNHESKALEFYLRMRSSSRKGIIEIFDSGRTDDGLLYYVMPLGTCTLFDLAKSRLSKKTWFSLSEIKNILSQIFDALESLEREGLVHRDLKPSNIIFLGGKVYISDLGLLEIEDDGMSRYGTENFCAPHYFKGNPDHWSVACIIFFLLTSKYPEHWNSQGNWVSPLGVKSMSRADIAEYERLRNLIFNRATAYREIDLFRSAHEFRVAVLNPKKRDRSLFYTVIFLIVIFYVSAFFYLTLSGHDFSFSKFFKSQAFMSKKSELKESKVQATQNERKKPVQVVQKEVKKIEVKQAEVPKADVNVKGVEASASLQNKQAWSSETMSESLYKHIKSNGDFDRAKGVRILSIDEWMNEGTELFHISRELKGYQTLVYYGINLKGSLFSDLKDFVRLKHNREVMEVVDSLWSAYMKCNAMKPVYQIARRFNSNENRTKINPEETKQVRDYTRLEPFYKQYVEMMLTSGGKNETLLGEKIRDLKVLPLDYNLWVQNIETLEKETQKTREEIESRASSNDENNNPVGVMLAQGRYNSARSYQKLDRSMEAYNNYVNSLVRVNKLLKILEKPAAEY